MIRSIVREDLADLQVVLSTIELFPKEALEEMIIDYLGNSSCPELWYTYVIDGKAIALAFCAPEKFTEGTYNLYAVGVHACHQGNGIGQKMINHIEQQLIESGQRLLIVETSGSTEMSSTRTFYLRCGYQQEAIIRDFWQTGEDKVIFSKHL